MSHAAPTSIKFDVYAADIRTNKTCTLLNCLERQKIIFEKAFMDAIANLIIHVYGVASDIYINNK